MSHQHVDDIPKSLHRPNLCVDTRPGQRKFESQSSSEICAIEEEEEGAGMDNPPKNEPLRTKSVMERVGVEENEKVPNMLSFKGISSTIQYKSRMRKLHHNASTLNSKQVSVEDAANAVGSGAGTGSAAFSGVVGAPNSSAAGAASSVSNGFFDFGESSVESRDRSSSVKSVGAGVRVIGTCDNVQEAFGSIRKNRRKTSWDPSVDTMFRSETSSARKRSSKWSLGGSKLGRFKRSTSCPNPKFEFPSNASPEISSFSVQRDDHVISNWVKDSVRIHGDSKKRFNRCITNTLLSVALARIYDDYNVDKHMVTSENTPACVSPQHASGGPGRSPFFGPVIFLNQGGAGAVLGFSTTGLGWEEVYKMAFKYKSECVNVMDFWRSAYEKNVKPDVLTQFGFSVFVSKFSLTRPPSLSPRAETPFYRVPNSVAVDEVSVGIFLGRWGNESMIVDVDDLHVNEEDDPFFLRVARMLDWFPVETPKNPFFINTFYPTHMCQEWKIHRKSENMLKEHYNRMHKEDGVKKDSRVRDVRSLMMEHVPCSPLGSTLEEWLVGIFEQFTRTVDSDQLEENINQFRFCIIVILSSLQRLNQAAGRGEHGDIKTDNILFTPTDHLMHRPTVIVDKETPKLLSTPKSHPGTSHSAPLRSTSAFGPSGPGVGTVFDSHDAVGSPPVFPHPSPPGMGTRSSSIDCCPVDIQNSVVLRALSNLSVVPVLLDTSLTTVGCFDHFARNAVNGMKKFHVEVMGMDVSHVPRVNFSDAAMLFMSIHIKLRTWREYIITCMCSSFVAREKIPFVEKKYDDLMTFFGNCFTELCGVHQFGDVSINRDCYKMLSFLSIHHVRVPTWMKRIVDCKYKKEDRLKESIEKIALSPMESRETLQISEELATRLEEDSGNWSILFLYHKDVFDFPRSYMNKLPPRLEIPVPSLVHKRTIEENVHNSRFASLQSYFLYCYGIYTLQFLPNDLSELLDRTVKVKGPPERRIGEIFQKYHMACSSIMKNIEDEEIMKKYKCNPRFLTSEVLQLMGRAIKDNRSPPMVLSPSYIYTYCHREKMFKSFCSLCKIFTDHNLWVDSEQTSNPDYASIQRKIITDQNIRNELRSNGWFVRGSLIRPGAFKPIKHLLLEGNCFKEFRTPECAMDVIQTERSPLVHIPRSKVDRDMFVMFQRNRTLMGQMKNEQDPEKKMDLKKRLKELYEKNLMKMRKACVRNRFEDSLHMEKLFITRKDVAHEIEKWVSRGNQTLPSKDLAESPMKLCMLLLASRNDHVRGVLSGRKKPTSDGTDLEFERVRESIARSGDKGMVVEESEVEYEKQEKEEESRISSPSKRYRSGSQQGFA